MLMERGHRPAKSIWLSQRVTRTWYRTALTLAQSRSDQLFTLDPIQDWTGLPLLSLPEMPNLAMDLTTISIAIKWTGPQVCNILNIFLTHTQNPKQVHSITFPPCSHSTEKIVFSVDDVETGTIKAGTGFWSRGSFEANAPGTANPWRLATPIAPFDQEV